MQNINLICKSCGQPIRDRYLSALGAVWHPEHFVCTFCHLPVQEARFQVYENAPCHPECYAQWAAPRCVYCGKPLVGSYLVDNWGQAFCREHQGNYPPCAYCGRLVAPQQREPHAEVVRCPVCRSTAIDTEVEARPLFSKVIRWLTGEGLYYHNLRLSLELCSKQRLSSLLQGNHGTHSLGVTTSSTYSQGGHVVRTEVNGVAILQGLPASLFQGVTTHEAGHVWLIVHEVRGLTEQMEEGFCEFLAHRYYASLSGAEAVYFRSAIEQNPDTIYGKGFRSVAALVQARGFPWVLETLQTQKRLPLV